jgi:hypothetical protein
MYLSLALSIHITSLPKVALEDVVCVSVEEKLQDYFISVKAVM